MINEPGEVGGTGYFGDDLDSLLRAAVADGGLLACVVTTTQGLPMASAESKASPEMLAALGTLFDEIALRAESLLSWPNVEEVSLVGNGGLRLVARVFGGREGRFLLVAVVPAGRPYRRITTRLIRSLLPLMGRWSDDADA